VTERKKWLVIAVYWMATIQVAWCYFSLTSAYVRQADYEMGLERMPFQGRMLMMWPLRWAHHNFFLQKVTDVFGVSPFWFPRPVAPEILLQGIVNVLCLALAGYVATKIYCASSRTRLLSWIIYPMTLLACVMTYIMHTAQNFRFIYDLPSLAFFAGAMYLLYFRKPVGYFIALFLVATINRETTLLLLPLYMLNSAVSEDRLRLREAFRPRVLGVVVPLAVFWVGWQITIHHLFGHNRSEFYPRLDWNMKSLLVPQAWPQLLSACGYLMVFVVLMRRWLTDARLTAWLWLLPLWVTFMFVYGILVETRVFAELIPFIVPSAALIFEELLLARMRQIEIAHGYESRAGIAVVSRAA
jgi:hypothetical protein